MRIAEFKAENFRTLEKKLNEIDWGLFLKNGNNIKYEVSSRHSRLYHKNAIAERTKKIISKYFVEHSTESISTDKSIRKTVNVSDKQIISGKVGLSEAGNIFEAKNIPKEPDPCKLGAEQINKHQKIFIRAMENHFVVSLDSSGDLLHKRGKKIFVGKAPLRENLGFAVLVAVGYSGKEILVDPMCGSGTFSLEAAMKLRNIPPGFFRDFAFQDWPCFSSAWWEYFKKQARSHFLPETDRPYIFASDIDPEAMENLKKTVMAYEVSSSIDISNMDFFDIIPKDFTDEKGIVVLNPPYGKRISDQGNSYSFFIKIGDKLKRDFKGWNAGVILPYRDLIHTLPFSVSLTPFSHGGLKIFAATGKII